MGEAPAEVPIKASTKAAKAASNAPPKAAPKTGASAVLRGAPAPVAAAVPSPAGRGGDGAAARAKPRVAKVQVRAVRLPDLPAVIALDATVTGLHKSDYWQRIYRRYGVSGQGLRHFLVAAVDGSVCGFVIGEVRDWEFGSPPCGWVFAIDVDPRCRQRGVGTALLAEVCRRFERVGVDKLRTMLARDNALLLSFFRSQGLTAGRLIPLELDLPSVLPAALAAPPAPSAPPASAAPATRTGAAR